MQIAGNSSEALKYFLLKKWPALLFMAILSFFVAFFESLSTLAVYPVLALATTTSVLPQSNKYLNLLMSWIGTNGVMFPLYMAVFLLFVLTTIKLVLSYGHVLLTWETANKITQETQVEMISSLLSADYQFLVNAQKGDLAYRGLTAPGYLGKVVNLIPTMVVDVLKIFMIIMMLFVVSKWVTFFFFMFSLFYYFITKYVAQNVSYGTGSGRARSASNQSIHLMNALKGIKSIRLHGTVKHWVGLFGKECRNFYLFARKDALISGLPATMLEFVAILFVCSLVLFFNRGGNGIISNIPLLGVFAFSLLKILPGLKQVSSSGMSLMSMLPHAEAAFLALSEAEKYQNRSEGINNLQGFSSKIEVNRISFEYLNSDKPVLRGVNITINKGEFIGIIGPSGSGKTTLLDILAGLLSPSIGKVLVDGEALNSYSSESLAKHIGYVGQDTFLFNDTIRENILFGREGFDDEAVKEALRRADALDFVRSFPQGLDGIIADDGMKLSGGQRQRLSIARALLRNPEIILLDEATSALDYKTEKNILGTILRLVREEGKTVIFVTHRKSAIQHADRVIEMRDGKVIGVPIEK